MNRERPSVEETNKDSVLSCLPVQLSAALRSALSAARVCVCVCVCVRGCVFVCGVCSVPTHLHPVLKYTRQTQSHTGLMKNKYSDPLITPLVNKYFLNKNKLLFFE